MPLEIRTAPITRAAETTDTGAREFDAIAVPYDTWTELWPGYRERFMPGSLEPASAGVKLRLEHRETIGTVPVLDNQNDGAHFTGRISKTRAGDDAYELAKDEALNRCSIGFIPDDDTMEIVQLGNGDVEITHHRATLIEVSLVTNPAYEDTPVTAIRTALEKEPNMPTAETITIAESAELRAALEELGRKVDLNTTAQTTPAAGPEFMRSAGEFMRAAAAGQADALALATRAFADDAGVLADSNPRPQWLERTILLMDAKMRLTNLFTHAATLPSEGNVLEFPELESDTMAVAKQENEGDTLTVGKVKFTSGSATVNTYGGYSPLSRQVIERSPASYLDTVHRAQALAYARTIETATRDLFKAVTTARLAATPITTTSALADLDISSLTDILMDLAIYYDTDSLYPLAGFIISPDVAKLLALIPKTETALQWTGAPDGKQGTLTITGPRAELAGISCEIIPQINTGTLAAYASPAIEVLESPGAPMRLTQETVTNLTTDVAVYGYASHFAPAPSAIVPVKFGA